MALEFGKLSPQEKKPKDLKKRENYNKREIWGFWIHGVSATERMSVIDSSANITNSSRSCKLKKENLVCVCADAVRVCMHWVWVGPVIYTQTYLMR